MEQSLHQPNPLMQLLPLVLIMVPMIFVINRLAKEKGKNVTLWTILACIPFVNMIILPYIVGTPSKIQEDKINKIIKLLNKRDQV
ncbi:hypothetical protein DMA11_22130 [Marinilabiliaceae bacterium JC017]|nr:hypothetical protein DMA11_22130 [Marinilabiliaceae bacterium JC017]